MHITYKENSLKYLSTFADNYMSLGTRVAIISLHNNVQHAFFEGIILVFEYLQLFSQALLLRSILYNTPIANENLLFKIIVYAAKLINPSYLLPFDSNDSVTTAVLFAILGFMVFKFLFLGYILYLAFFNIKGSKQLVGVWRIFFKAQGRVMYYFISSFWLRTIQLVSDDNFTMLGIGKSAIISFCAVLIVLEFALSLIPKIICCYILPTKSFLAARDNHLEVASLSQKFLIQILQIALPFSSTVGDWTLTTFNLVLSISKAIHFYRTLPLYNFTALKLQAYLLMLVNSLNVSSILQLIVNSAGYKTSDIRFLLTLTIILALLSFKIGQIFLNYTVIRLVTSPMYALPGLIIQKVSAIRQLKKVKKLGLEINGVSDMSYLITQTIHADIKTILGVDVKEEEAKSLPTNLYSKGDANKIFQHFLENLGSKLQKSPLIKVYMAYVYAKKLKLYGKAMKLIAELQKDGPSLITLNALLLLYDIQIIIRNENRQSENSIDLSRFVKTQALAAQLKQRMIDQAKLQAGICQEMTTDAPNLHKIFHDSQIVFVAKQDIEGKINQILNIIPEYFLKPLLVCSHYHLTLNYSMNEYMKFYKLYVKKYQKYEKFFKGDELSEITFYQENNAFFVLSGQKSDLGKIIFCTKTVEDICGGELRAYMGVKISTAISLPRLENIYEAFFKSCIESGDKSLFNKVTRTYVSHKEGHMVEVEYYMDIHPFVTQGFYITFVMRPTLNHKEFILIHENGDIEGATKRVGEKLGILTSRGTVAPRYNIQHISEDLNLINHAFNIVDNPDEHRRSFVSERGILQSPTLGLGSFDHNSETGFDSFNLKTNLTQKNTLSKPKMDLEEAQKIYQIYSEKGNEISVVPIHSPHEELDWEKDSFNFLCKINNINFASKQMRIICLEQYMIDNHGMATPNGGGLYSPKPGDGYEDEVIMEVQENKEATTQNYMEESIDFREENEKEGGWIDFKSMRVEQELEPEPVSYLLLSPVSNQISFLESPGRLSAIRDQSTTLDNQNLLLSPAASSLSDRNHNGGEKKFLFNKLVRKHRTLAKFKKIIEYSSKTDSFLEQKANTPRTARTAVGSIASTASRVSSRTRILKAFKAALEVKHSPKLLRIVCVLFYLFLVAIIFSLVFLKLTLDSSTETLNVKKDILSSAQLRTQNLASIEGILRPLSDLGTGRLVNSDFGLVASPITIYFTIARVYLTALITTNEQIFTNAYLLEEDVRSSLFEKDVRIYGTNLQMSEAEYINVTSFQGTQIIIETIFKMLAVAEIDVTQSVPQFDFFLRNALNDLLVKNTEISSNFLQSAREEIDDIQFIIITYLILAFILLGIVNFTLLLNVWKQYVREKNNMIAFTRLNINEVKIVMNKINHFKNVLEKDSSFEESQGMPSIAEFAKVSDLGNYKRTVKEHVKTPRYSGITRKYLLYVRSWAVFLGFLVGVIIWSALTAQGYLSSFKDKLHQLDFMNRMNTKVNLATLIFMELTPYNGQTLIENVRTEIGALNVINDIKNIRNELNEVIVNSDLINIGKIERTLFYNGCAELDPSSASYCKVLSIKGIQSAFLQLITAFENFIVDRYNAFLVSDRTTASLKEIEVTGYDTLISLKRILTMEIAIISSTVSKTLEDYIKNGNNQRNLVFVVCSICLLILLCLVWVYILKRLSEADNQFKKVLRMLPGDLVFSSFLLKSFLMKTSHGLLNLTRDRL